MIECPKCGAAYEQQRVFCGKCGNRMGNPCRSCKFYNLIDDRFCGQCGRSLGVSGPDPQETSTPTSGQGNNVLFYDQLLFDARKDKESFSRASPTMDRAAIQQLFQEQKD